MKKYIFLTLIPVILMSIIPSSKATSSKTLQELIDELNAKELQLKEISDEKNLTQEVLAEMSKISCAYMGQIERGESSLSLKTLDSIVSFTGVSTDFILYGDESQNSYVKKLIEF